MKVTLHSSRDAADALAWPPDLRGSVAGRFHVPLRFTERRVFLLVGDILALCIAAIAAVAAWAALRPNVTFGVHLIAEHGRWLLGLELAWLPLQAVAGSYDLRLAAHPWRVTGRLLLTALLFVALYLGFFFLTSTPPTMLFPGSRGAVGLRLLRAVPLLFVGFALVGEIAWRTLYATTLTGRRFQRRTLVIGAGWAGATIVEALRENADGSYNVIGFVDDDPDKQGMAICVCGEGDPPRSFRVLGDRHALRRLTAEQGVSTLILAITHEVTGDLLPVLLDCLELGVEIVPMAVLYEQLTGRVPVEHVEGSWYVSLPINHPGAGTTWPAAKRLMDVFLACLGLLILGLLLPVLALAIYLDSPGPIFYTQDRVGKGGRLFKIYKFRSMVVGAEKGEARWAEEHDGRVTRVGRLLRRVHLDEFPQFWNILKGDMSIVGPRPERPEFAERLAAEMPFYRIRHAVKPGATGWALVQQGYSASEEGALLKLQYDLYYIKHQSLWLDLVILLRTVVHAARFGGR